MNTTALDQVAVYSWVQYIAWLIALVELVLGLYILALNNSHPANRYSSFVLLVIAANSYAVGLLSTAQSGAQAALPAALLAASTPAIQPVLLVASVAILRPNWLSRRTWGGVGAAFWQGLGILGLLPALATLVDLLSGPAAAGGTAVPSGTHLWYTGLPPGYTGGFANLPVFTAGSLGPVIRAYSFSISAALVLLLLFYFSFFDRRLTRSNRVLARVLFTADAIAAISLVALSPRLIPAVTILFSSLVFALAYAFAGYQQMISERRLQRGSLQLRLTALILVVTVPLLVAVSAFVVNRAGLLLGQGSGAGYSFLRSAALLIVGGGAVLLLAMVWFTIRQAIQPVLSLTRTATGIAAGDLTLVAPVETDDELGQLARAFNSMTSQLRELITNLERRVSDRTREMERRTLQLQVTAEVAAEAAGIHDLEDLLTHAVGLISDKFGFYHAGIFLLDETGKYAVLRAASSEGGKNMLARQHRLQIGAAGYSGQGIVGYVAGQGEPRIALDVGVDAAFFNNPDLPQTRSEMALPLKAGGNRTAVNSGSVIGVLDVQSTKAGAFTADDIATLQILADQLTLAIENARLLAESQETLRQMETLLQQQVSRAWSQRLAQRGIRYTYDHTGVHALPADGRPIAGQPITGQADSLPYGGGDDPRLLVAAIVLRGQTLGSLTLRRDPHQPPWRSEERDLVRATLAQVALTLDNARLLEENRRTALTEQAIGQITTRAQTSLDLDTILKTAVEEIGRALGGPRVQIRLSDTYTGTDHEK